MPSDFHSKKYILPKYSKADYSALMKLIHNSLTFELSDATKYRLHVLNHYYKHGWRSTVDAFGLGKSTLYDWKTLFERSDKKLSSLVPTSTKPKKVRQMQTPAQVMGFIKALRIKYPRLSKYKIKPFLDIFCQEQGISTHSVSWIGKLINRHQFFFKTRLIVRKKGRSFKSGTRIKYCPRQKDIKLGYIERFNWTLQDEFINYEIDTVLVSLKDFDTKLRDWNHYYNHVRPHQSLKYQTPHQFLLQLQVNKHRLTQNTDCAKCV